MEMDILEPKLRNNIAVVQHCIGKMRDLQRN